MKRLLILLAFLPLFGYSQIKVSEMTSATSVGDSDIFLLIQGGSSKKVAFSVFDYGEAEVATQIGDSLTDYRVEVANQIHDSIPVGSTITIGAQYQIPYTNALGTDFDYSSNFTWNGTSLVAEKGTRNIFIGTSAGLNTTGTDNTFLGYTAGVSNIIGDYNTFIGSLSGYSNSSGDFNTFNGYHSGYSNTTGQRNTFIGYSTGNLNTTGNYNTFLGYNTGSANVSGSNNVFLGRESGISNTTGYENVFTGSFTGLNNTTGYDNTFLGYITGYSNTTGYKNVFIGQLTGYGNISGINNSFIGVNSGKSNTTGSDNSYLGIYSGYTNTTGTNNTFLGGYAGYNNITGSSNVFLGYQAGLNETGSNKLYISNNATDTLIYAEFDNDSLHINGNLSIDGNIYANNIAPVSGSQYQIPYLNAAGDGFDVSSSFTWNDTTLTLNAPNNNTFVGFNTGLNISTGWGNNFLGYGAGDLVTDATASTFIGYNAGGAQTVGNDNIFIGYQSGILNVDGVWNTMIGNRTGVSNTAGDYNTFLGGDAGRTNLGSSNIFLGYKSGENETGSNKLYIENSNSATPLIYGELDNNYVQINDSLKVTKSITLGENTGENYKAGKLYYDTTDQALTFFNDQLDFTWQLGRETPVRFFNNTGSTITNGTLLRSLGAKVNGSITFIADLAGNYTLDSLQGVAMATVDVLDGTFGEATLIGQVNGLNTSAFSDNDLLWVGCNGTVVNISPEPPQWSAIIGRVVYADADSGAIYMFPVSETKYFPNPTFTARFEDSTEVITNPGTGVYELITSATGTLFEEIRNVGFTFQGDSISPMQDGNYTTFFSYSFQGTASQTDLYRIAVYVDGVKQYSTSRTASGTNNGGVPFPYSAALTAGQWISFRITNLSDASRDATFTDGTITINFSQ